MCGRYSLICIDDLGNRFRVFDPMMGVRSRFNVAPSQEMPVIIRSGGNHLVVMRWGLVPAGTTERRAPLINARAESLAEKPAFRNLLPARRCLVPASGFYEWKREGKRKVPYYIRLRADPLFAFAGLYSSGGDPGGGPASTFTIITCPANSLVKPLHDRMPVILTRQAEERWLDPAALQQGEMNRILVPYPEDRMEAYPVSDRVNNPATDDERMIQPLASSSGVQKQLPV